MELMYESFLKKDMMHFIAEVYYLNSSGKLLKSQFLKKKLALIVYFPINMLIVENDLEI